MLDLRRPFAKSVFFGLLVLLGLFIFFPLFWLLTSSLKPTEELFVRIPSLLPGQPTFRHYMTAITDDNIFLYVVNSLISATGSSILTTFLAAHAAFGFAKYRYFGKRGFMYLLLSAQMFPFAMLLITLFPMLNAWNLTDTYVGLILGYLVFALPTGTYMLYSYFSQLPSELIEAARVDGASDLRIMYTIIFPLSIPGLVTVGLYAFMWAWKDLLFSLTLVTSSNMRTIGPGLLLTYFGEASSDWGAAMAASVVVSLPVVIAFLFLQRYFIQGMLGGSVKS